MIPRKLSAALKQAAGQFPVVTLLGPRQSGKVTLGGRLSALEASFVVMRLHPYHANLGKRLVKTPKLYFTEPGLLTWLPQIESPEQAARSMNDCWRAPFPGANRATAVKDLGYLGIGPNRRRL